LGAVSESFRAAEELIAKIKRRFRAGQDTPLRKSQTFGV
jgi:hypothetical protein